MPGSVIVRVVDDVSDDLAPAITAFCSAAIMRCAGQWNNADNDEFEADG
jgi:hypothetical protein